MPISAELDRERGLRIHLALGWAAQRVREEKDGAATDAEREQAAREFEDDQQWLKDARRG